MLEDLYIYIYIYIYICITGSEKNKDVYIKHSYRKENGKTSSRIYKKLEKYNELLQQFDGDHEKMMAWAKEKANKETNLYVQTHGKVTVEFSKSLYHSLSSITNLSTLFP